MDPQGKYSDSIIQKSATTHIEVHKKYLSFEKKPCALPCLLAGG